MLNHIGFAQIDKSETQLYQWTDSIIGQKNTGIYNGLVYTEKHRMINEKHKFFKELNFVFGEVVYDDKLYTKVRMKYNVFEDQLILKHSFSPKDPSIILNKSRVKSFRLFGHQFNNLSFTTLKGATIEGFFETLLKTDSLQLLKKHKKRIRSKTNENSRYYEFIENNNYVLIKNNQYIIIKNPKKLEKQFPRYEKFIDDIELDTEKEKNKDYDDYLVAVFRSVKEEMITPLESKE
ncbi:hypothetical protein [uncultured Winogradskyella sp.]|uniref:hypothetical protein n=1 Tax=uncultured Winogradskyella sp. TaxID=395353 RepID=UPI00261AF154|nr:hypothetical protein [uncultured Winogradskyella sp.]